MKSMKLCFLFLLGMVFSFNAVNAQDGMESKESLMAQKAEKAAEFAKVAGELAAIEGKIASIPGWRIGGVGVVGGTLNSNNDWYALSTPNSASSGLGVGFNGYANNIQSKFFWRNLLNVTFNQTSTQANKNLNTPGVIALSEGLDLSSLYGYRISPKFAVSAEGKFTTSLVQYDAEKDKYRNSFLDPGKITVSAGLTWTPMDALVVIIHPLGYELNFPGDFISAPGAKIGATYSGKLFKRIAWSSNLSAFIPYGGAGDSEYTDALNVPFTVNYTTGDLLNYTWINGFSTNLYKGLGATFNLGLRGDNQIANRSIIGASELPAEAILGGLKIQSYYTAGLSYTF